VVVEREVRLVLIIHSFDIISGGLFFAFTEVSHSKCGALGDLGGRTDYDVSRHVGHHRLDDMAFHSIGALALQRRPLSNSCQFLVFLAFAAAGPVGAALLVCSR
jgi:hypothetical protein